MKIKIAIVDDDKTCVETIKNYVKRYEQESGIELETDVFLDGDEIVSDYIPKYQIIFLDIQMKRLDGMKTAEKIREFDKNVILIFITNMAQYAVKGYSVAALDFLLKPVPYFAFSQQLKRSIELVKSHQNKFLLVSTDNGVSKINVQEIVFIEILNRKTILHTVEKDLTMTATMKDIEKKLENSTFFRCNHCYIVNLAFIHEVNGYIVNAGGFELTVSRPRKNAFMDALANYVGGVIK